jgi:hypothetical protein
MDPQLEEYRRKQRERAAASSKSAATSGKRSWIVVGAVATVVVCIAIASQLSVADAAAGTSTLVQGTCPKADGLGVCVEECSAHSDCASQGKLCCSNGCGHVCMAPVKPGAAPAKKKCTLMVTLAEEGAEAAVLQAVPAPSSRDLMQSIGILTLEYAPGRSSDCCEAERILRGMPEAAKYVEYDGRAPDCAEQTQEGFSSQQLGGEMTAEVNMELLEQEERVVGGWSEESEALDESSLDVWDKVVAKTPSQLRLGGVVHDFGALGRPITVKTQVVAGTNYVFGFKSGATVTVFHQPWTDTLEVVDVNDANL